MIDLEKIASVYGERILFSGPKHTINYQSFHELVEAKRGDIRGQPVTALNLLTLDWSPDSFADLLARFLERQSILLGSEFPETGLDAFEAQGPLFILKTGGTTGEPRHVVHSVETFLSPYSLQDRQPSRLLVLFAPDHIAGIDAFFQALHRGGTLVIPPDMSPGAIVASIMEEKVEVLPATPTFLQFLLLSGELEGLDCSSVTTIPHGAEPMPPTLRQRLMKVFPNARLLQRFGMTELGALPVRPDPDYPEAMFLDEGAYQWKVVEGELQICSPTRMLGSLEDGPVEQGSEWHATGDLAEETPNGSIRVLGRREAMINIGGTKIIPELVESMILEQDGVLDAAAHAVPNPLTGQALCARVIFEGEPDPHGLMKSLRRVAREKGLSLAHVPTRIEAVGELHSTGVGKRLRTQGKA